jgi:hypothetical protein
MIWSERNNRERESVFNNNNNISATLSIFFISIWCVVVCLPPLQYNDPSHNFVWISLTFCCVVCAVNAYARTLSLLSFRFNLAQIIYGEAKEGEGSRTTIHMMISPPHVNYIPYNTSIFIIYLLHPIHQHKKIVLIWKPRSLIIIIIQKSRALILCWMMNLERNFAPSRIN